MPAALVAVCGAGGRPVIVVHGVCTPDFYYTRGGFVKLFITYVLTVHELQLTLMLSLEDGKAVLLGTVEPQRRRGAERDRRPEGHLGEHRTSKEGRGVDDGGGAEATD